MFEKLMIVPCNRNYNPALPWTFPKTSNLQENKDGVAPSIPMKYLKNASSKICAPQYQNFEWQLNSIRFSVSIKYQSLLSTIMKSSK